MGVEALVIGGLVAAGTGAKAYGAYKQAKAQQKAVEAQKEANEYNAKIYEHNAKLMYEKSEDVKREGLKTEQKFRQYVEGVKGKQQTSFGASGAVVNSGSTMDVIEDTQALGEMDAMQIRYNAAKQSKAYEEQAVNARQNAKLSRMGSKGLKAPSPAWAVGGTLLTGASEITQAAFKYS